MSIQLELRLARRYSEIVECQYLIAEVYNRYYDVVFTRDEADLDSKVEPYPHRYVMGLVDGELVAAAGLYRRDTYVERYGDITLDAVQRLLDDAGIDRPATGPRREYTKLVVDQAWEGRGLGRFFFAATHSRDFIASDMDGEPLLLACAKRTIWEHLYDKSGIRTRRIAPFPDYKVHEFYRSETDPMDSRLIVPSVDIPARLWELPIPGTYEVPDRRTT